MPAGKEALVDLPKGERAPSMGVEDQTRASEPMSETAGWWWALTGEDRIVCSKVSGDWLQIRQVVGPWLSQVGIAWR